MQTPERLEADARQPSPMPAAPAVVSLLRAATVPLLVQVAPLLVQVELPGAVG